MERTYREKKGEPKTEPQQRTGTKKEKSLRNSPDIENPSRISNIYLSRDEIKTLLRIFNEIFPAARVTKSRMK